MCPTSSAGFSSRIRAGSSGGCGVIACGTAELVTEIDTTAVDARHVPPVHVPTRYERLVKPLIDRVGGLKPTVEDVALVRIRSAGGACIVLPS